MNFLCQFIHKLPFFVSKILIPLSFFVFTINFLLTMCLH